MTTPTFFLSSTIYDFKDLRSAIKYELENRGCQVLASDHNDFGNDPNLNSYEACLRQIDNADFFILLIGSRVGGKFDQDQSISITRAEYRHAYKRHLEGKLKILPFVRRSIWDVKEDRAAIKKVIEQTELTEKEVYSIVSSPSKHLNDAKHIFDFIDEVTRKHEFKEALQRGGTGPTGNWIYGFDTFEEIVSVFSNAVFLGESKQEHLVKQNLRDCLLRTVSDILSKHKSTVFVPALEIYNISLSYPLSMERWQFPVKIPVSVNGLLNAYSIRLTKIYKDAEPVKMALRSRVFHRFENTSGMYQETPATNCLRQLLEFLGYEVEFSHSQWIMSQLEDNSPDSDPMNIRFEQAILLFSEARRQLNIFRICQAFLKFLAGENFIEPNLVSKFVEEGDTGNPIITKAEIEELLGIPIQQRQTS